MKSNVVNCYICYRKKEISVKFNVPNKDAIKYIENANKTPKFPHSEFWLMAKQESCINY